MWFEGPKGELFNLDKMSNIKVQVSITAGSSWYLAANEAGSSDEHRLSENMDEESAQDLRRRLARALQAETADSLGRQQPGGQGSVA